MKTKIINIILLFILIFICIILLYILFNNKHNEIYNNMNKLILKEKFNNLDISSECINTESICPDLSLVCKPTWEDEGCENEEKFSQYCNYLSRIQDVLKSSCFTCDEKNNIIDTAKRVKCLSLAQTIDESQ